MRRKLLGTRDGDQRPCLTCLQSVRITFAGRNDTP